MRENGSPAYPRPYSCETNGSPDWAQDGMSLRDYFAGQVIVAVADRSLLNGEADVIAQRAYALADAMLKERAR